MGRILSKRALFNKSYPLIHIFCGLFHTKFCKFTIDKIVYVYYNQNIEVESVKKISSNEMISIYANLLASVEKIEIKGKIYYKSNNQRIKNILEKIKDIDYIAVLKFMLLKKQKMLDELRSNRELECDDRVVALQNDLARFNTVYCSVEKILKPCDKEIKETKPIRKKI